VGRLLAAARTSAPLAPAERGVVGGQARALLGDLASVASRVRGLRDGLEGARDACGSGGAGGLVG
jgi:hypothetical protein